MHTLNFLTGYIIYLLKPCTWKREREMRALVKMLKNALRGLTHALACQNTRARVSKPILCPTNENKQTEAFRNSNYSRKSKLSASVKSVLRRGVSNQIIRSPLLVHLTQRFSVVKPKLVCLLTIFCQAECRRMECVV
jgi:hypothetical protein